MYAPLISESDDYNTESKKDSAISTVVTAQPGSNDIESQEELLLVYRTTVTFIVLDVTYTKPTLTADMLGIAFIAGTNNWTLISKLKLLVHTLFFLIMLGVSIGMHFQKNSSTNEITGEKECSSEFNREYCARLVISLLSLLRQLVPGFRQYLLHMLGYEWPLMRCGVPIRYVNGSLINPLCCSDGEYMRSALTAEANLFAMIFYIVAFVTLISSQKDIPACHEYSLLNEAFTYYLAASFLSTLSYTAMLKKFCTLECIERLFVC